MRQEGRRRVGADITIRTATVADYPGFLRVAHEVHEHHVRLLPEVFRSVEVAAPEEYFAQVVANDDSDALLAESDGVIVGYAILHYQRTIYDIQVPRVYGYINNFGVLEAYRRRSVARRLFEACAARVKEMGGATLELHCWEVNQDAIRFYEAMGMTTTRRYLSLDL